MNKIYLLIGGNLGNRMKNLELARNFINDKIGSIKNTSSVYETEPWGFDHKNSFYNQAVESDTLLSPLEVLTLIKSFENKSGKIKRTNYYLPREIDIDILFYNDEIIKLPDLIIPHPKIRERNFVLKPLKEMIPDFIHPAFNLTVTQLFDACEDISWVKKIV